MRPSQLPNPPGQVESLSAERVLVLAPHADDEIVGCGGLLAQLADAGATVRVLLLTDGAAGGAAAVRRAEAEAVAEHLGFESVVALDLPDGRLVDELAAAATAIAEQLESFAPDLLLVPSPTEISGDHRAAFAALHRALSRPSALDAPSGPDTPSAPLDVLLYEINHPQHPDLLVDVGPQLPAIEAAMALYASQEAQHPYLAAALGLRRWRTLTLGPDVESAEAYRRVALSEFQTRGPAALVAWLGGTQGAVDAAEASMDAGAANPLVSVIVRTKDRPELLAEALDSLAESTWRPLEVLVVNDGGAPPDEVIAARAPLFETRAIQLRRVDLPENLGRAGAANAGVAAARGEYVAFCDDDDQVEPDHFAALVGAARAAGVRVVYSDAAVGVYRLGADGWEATERRLPYSRDFDRDLLLFDNYIPFNTLLIERALFDEIDRPSAGAASGPFDPALPFFEDWEFLLRLAARVRFHHLARVTCEYRQFRGAGHHVLGDDPRARADFLEAKADVIARHRELLTPERAARVVDRLRAEAVRAEEAERSARDRLAESQRAFHALRGQLAAAQEHVGQLEALRTTERADAAARESDAHARLDAASDRLAAAIERRHQVERELGEVRAAGDERSSALRAAYEEIGRLDALVRGMRSTRAWRLHDRVQAGLARLPGRRRGTPS